MWIMKVGLRGGHSEGQSANPDKFASCCRNYCVASIVYSPPGLNCSTHRGPPLKIKFAISLWRFQTGEPFHWGIVEESGPMCWVCTVVNTRPATGDWLFFHPFSSFKSSRLRRETSSRHYQVDFEKNKSFCALLQSCRGRDGRKITSPLNRLVPVCPQLCFLDVFSWMYISQKIILLIIFFLSYLLISPAKPWGCLRY